MISPGCRPNSPRRAKRSPGPDAQSSAVAGALPLQSHNSTALPAFELGDEEDLAALMQLLVIAGLIVEFAVDGDRGLLLEMLAEPRIHLVEGLDDAAQGLCLDLEFAHAAGVAAAEPARQSDPRGRLGHSFNPRHPHRARRGSSAATSAIRSAAFR